MHWRLKWFYVVAHRECLVPGFFLVGWFLFVAMIVASFYHRTDVSLWPLILVLSVPPPLFTIILFLKNRRLRFLLLPASRAFSRLDIVGKDTDAELVLLEAVGRHLQIRGLAAMVVSHVFVRAPLVLTNIHQQDWAAQLENGYEFLGFDRDRIHIDGSDHICLAVLRGGGGRGREFLIELHIDHFYYQTPTNDATYAMHIDHLSLAERDHIDKNLECLQRLILDMLLGGRSHGPRGPLRICLHLKAAAEGGAGQRHNLELRSRLSSTKKYVLRVPCTMVFRMVAIRISFQPDHTLFIVEWVQVDH